MVEVTNFEDQRAIDVVTLTLDVETDLGRAVPPQHRIHSGWTSSAS